MQLGSLLNDYLPIVIFLGISAVIGGALLLSAIVIAVNKPDTEKLSPYECGFAPFEDARIKFDVHFYLIAILFIIFDLEVAFLFPWAVTFSETGALGYFAMMTFLAELVIGYIYAWKKGALEWF